MRKSIVLQCKLLLQKKTVIFVYALMCVLVLQNYYLDVFEFEGYDVLDMYHPMQLLFLRERLLRNGLLFLQYVPILAVLPCAFAYIDDKKSGMEIFWVGRIGSKNYYFSKIIAVFLVTMGIFVVPLLAEIALKMLAFPLEAQGDISNLTIYDEILVGQIKKYLFSSLYCANPYLHAIVHNLLFGVWMGTLAAFATALSFLPFINFRVVLFLPVYALIESLLFVEQVAELEFTTNYVFYFLLYDSSPKSEIAYISTLLGLIIICLGMAYWKSRGDCRNR